MLPLALAVTCAAGAADLRVWLRSPTGALTSATFHDVVEGELPALRLPSQAGQRWTATFWYDTRHGAPGLSVRLVEQAVIGPFSGVPTRQLAGRIALSSTPASTRLPLSPSATLPSRLVPPTRPAWVVEAALGAAPAPVAAPVDDEAARRLLDVARQAAAAGDVATARRALDDLARETPGSRYDRAASQLRKELALFGTPAPALSVARWLQGSATYADAPATLLVFFEVWCPHCKRELPALVARADELRAAGVTVILVTRLTRSSTEEATVAFLQENEVWFPVAVDQDGLTTTAFEVSGIPAAALVRDGVVAWRGHPARLDADLLRRTLSAPNPPPP